MSDDNAASGEALPRDMLADIFERQARLAAYYHQMRPDGFYSWPPLQRATTWTRAIIHECCELDDELSWKPWKNPRALDETHEARLMETADILHFLIQLALDQGFSAEDLYRAYARKNEENHERQRSDPRYQPEQA